MTARDRAIAPAALAVLVLVATALISRYGVRLHNPQQDEYQVVFGGRFFATDPLKALFDTTAFTRGPERLTSMLLAIPDAIFGSTPRQMQAGHVVVAFAYALTAIPAYLLSVGLGLRRGPAAGTAARTILGPWPIFGNTYLDAAVGVLDPRAVRLGVVDGGRQARLARRPTGAGRGRAGDRRPRRGDPVPGGHGGRGDRGRLAIDHGVRRVVAPRAAAARARAPTPAARAARAAGGRRRRRRRSAGAGRPVYNGAVNGVPTLDELWTYLPVHFAELSMGTGYLPMIIGLPWILVDVLAWPATAATGAFAVIAVASFAVFVGLAAQAGATTEERYVAVLGLLPVIVGLGRPSGGARSRWSGPR